MKDIYSLLITISFLTTIRQRVQPSERSTAIMSLRSKYKPPWRAFLDAFFMDAPKTDPWLVNPCNYFTADQENDKSYRHSIRLLDTLKKLFLVDIVMNEDDCIEMKPSGNLRVDLDQEGKNSAQLDRRWTVSVKCPSQYRLLVAIMIVVLLILPVGHLQLGSALLIRRNYLIKVMSTVASSTSSLNKTKCIWEDELSQERKKLRRELEEIEEHIRSLGVCPSTTLLSVMFHSMLSFGAVIFYLITPVLLISRPLIADHIVYLLNPCAERKRILLKMERLIQVLLNSSALLIRRQIDAMQTQEFEKLLNRVSNISLTKALEIQQTLTASAKRAQLKLDTLISYLSDRQLVRPIAYSAQ